MSVPEELHDALDAWSFNVMLECSGRKEDQLECLVGGAVLDFRDLDRILTWAISTLPDEGQSPVQEGK